MGITWPQCTNLGLEVKNFLNKQDSFKDCAPEQAAMGHVEHVAVVDLFSALFSDPCTRGLPQSYVPHSVSRAAVQRLEERHQF